MSTNDVGLATERIQCSTENDLQGLHCSTICENILWKPVACEQCETHFCSKCIGKWLENNPNQCPMRCDRFIQRPCSKFIARLLTKLQVVCIYQSNGCNEIVPYEALEKHEMACGYHRLKCTGCQLGMLKKDITEHQFECPAIVAKCDDCKLLYQRADALRQHSDLICLRKQFRDYQQKSQEEILELQEQLRQTQNDQNAALVSRGISVDQLSVKRVFIPWTNKIGKQTEHVKNNCQDFRQAPALDDLLIDLAKLRIRCAYASNGCQMILSYNDLEEHERQCEFEIVLCQICQLPLSKREPIVEHTLRICFEEMVRKNPAPIQQQFLQLVNTTENMEAENRLLRSTINELRTKLNTLDSVCVKRNPT